MRGPDVFVRRLVAKQSFARLGEYAVAHPTNAGFMLEMDAQ